MASVVSERYALSLYEVAQSEGLVDQLFDELETVSRLFGEYPDYLKILTTPSIPFSEKKDVIGQVFAGRFHPYIVNFLMLLTERMRIGAIGEMAAAYKQLHDHAAGICEVTAVTAVPLSDALSEKLKEKMTSVTGKQIRLKNKVDPKLIGGVLVRIENNQIDDTIRHRLDELARQLTHTIA